MTTSIVCGSDSMRLPTMDGVYTDAGRMKGGGRRLAIDVGIDSVVLVLGLRSDPGAWIDVDQLVPLAGGGLGGRRAVIQALGELANAGLVERGETGGRNLYRRT